MKAATAGARGARGRGGRVGPFPTLLVAAAALCSLAPAACAKLPLEIDSFKVLYGDAEEGRLTHFCSRDDELFAAGVWSKDKTSGPLVAFGRLSAEGFETKNEVAGADGVLQFSTATQDGLHLVASFSGTTLLKGVEVKADSTFKANLLASLVLEDDATVNTVAFETKTPDRFVAIFESAGRTHLLGNSAEKVKINDKLYEEAGTVSFLLPLDNGEGAEEPIFSTPGSQGVCIKNTCQNGGTCSAVVNEDGSTVSLKCLCPEKLAGEKCEECAEDACQGECTVVDGAPKCADTPCGQGLTGPKCDQCIDNYCHNGGVCKVEDGKPECKCPENLAGARCDECAANFCQNGGSCTVKDEKPVCACPEGLAGDNCSVCEEDYCHNKGTCTVKEGGPACTCPDNLAGDRCDECAANFCQNGGSCTVKDEKPVCTCPEGLAGDNCDECVANYCHNGGSCSVEADKPVCACPTNLAGDQCDECAANFCENGGNCTVEEGMPECACPSGYSGDQCETEEPTKPPSRRRIVSRGSDSEVPEKRVITSSRSFQVSEEKPTFLVAAGYELWPASASGSRKRDESEVRIFVDQFVSSKTGDLALVSTVAFRAGQGQPLALPQLDLAYVDNEVLIAVTGGITEDTSADDFPLLLRKDEPSAAFVGMIFFGESVFQWATLVHGLGASMFSSNAFPVSFYEESVDQLSVLVAGPSSPTTMIDNTQAANIDTWPDESYSCFLASLSGEDGKPHWIRELFPKATAEVLAIHAKDGKAYLGGTFKGTEVQLDWLDKITQENPGAFVVEMSPPVTETTPAPTGDPIDLEESHTNLLFIGIVTLVVGAVLVFCWKRSRRGRKIKGRGNQRYAPVTGEYEMDHVEDVTVFAVEDEDLERGPRRY